MPDYQPLIYGLDCAPLPDTYTPLEASVVVKCLDDEGDVVLVTRNTESLKIWDRVGMLTVALDMARKDATGAFVADDDEEDA